MKTEDFIHSKADSASTRGLLLAVAMIMASSPASIGGDVPAAKKTPTLVLQQESLHQH